MDQDSSPKYSLPSIHEMFPDHLLVKRDEQRDSRDRTTSRESSSSRSRSSSQAQFASHPHSRAQARQFGMSPTITNVTMPPSAHPTYPPRVASHRSHQDPPYSVPQQSHRAGRHSSGDQRIVSFDVLRSDPTSSSLQHLASSATLPNRGLNLGSHPNQAGIDRGSAPAFRVSVSAVPPPTPDASSSRSRGNSLSLHPDISTIYIKERPTRSVVPNNAYPSMISFPISGSAPGTANPDAVYNLDDGGNGSDDDSPNEANNGKKHVCPTCLKRFNRPSSLRIHVNTHTGATPFRCPWPNCGREFNVNSNMRRHYRNHTTPGFSRNQPNDNRRRRRRVAINPPPPQFDPIPNNNNPTLRRVSHPFMQSPPITSYSVSDESDGYDSDYGNDGNKQDDQAEHFRFDPRASSWSKQHSLTQSMARVAVGSSRSSSIGHSQYQISASPRHHPYPLPNGRPFTPGSSFHSSSPSPSPSPPPQQREHMYSPSAPHLRSATDSRVSTALRPAFHSGRPCPERRTSSCDRVSVVSNKW